MIGRLTAAEAVVEGLPDLVHTPGIRPLFPITKSD